MIAGRLLNKKQMIKLKDYMKDGANYQAKAVLAFLQAGFYIEDSWCKERKEYKARDSKELRRARE